MSQKEGFLSEAYVSRFGEASSKQEINGYWMFAAGLVLGLFGLFVLAFSTMPEPRSASAFSRRQIAAVLGGVGLPLLMLGIVYRLPIKKTADRVALVGTVVCMGAVVAFVVFYPTNWNVAATSSAADNSLLVTGFYGVGLLIIGFAALVMPSMVKHVDVKELDESDGDLAKREDEVFKREGAASGREEAVSNREDDVSNREDAVGAREAAATDKKEKSGESKAEFFMYKDNAGEWRWNLRHRNGNIIADSAEGYSSKAGARNGLDSVRKNTPNAPIVEEGDEEDSQTNEEN